MDANQPTPPRAPHDVLLDMLLTLERRVSIMPKDQAIFELALIVARAHVAQTKLLQDIKEALINVPR